MKKNVFVIIVTYNGERWLKKCLDSLFQSTYAIKIIAIDNCSTDNSVSILKQYDEVDVIQSDINLGFGKANNIAITKALEQEADYLFLLNQDTWVYPDTIADLVEAAETNQHFGIVSPLHYSGDAVTLDKNFETYWSRKTKMVNDVIDEVPFVNAAAWLLPKKVIENVGVFEPMFSHYGEDRNFTDRLQYHQYKTVIVKNAKICHDRIISRNFKKDRIQSQFIVQAEVLNINHNIFLSYWRGFIAVLGLSKYFLKFYTISQVLTLFCNLCWFFVKMKWKIVTVIKKRNSYK